MAVFYVPSYLEAKLKHINKTALEVMEEALKGIEAPPPPPDSRFTSPQRQAVLNFLPSAAPGVSLAEIQAACRVSRPTAVAAVAACRDVQSAVIPRQGRYCGAPAMGYWLPKPSTTTTEAPPTPVEVKAP